MPDYQNPKTIADPDTRNGGMDNSSAALKGGSRKASADELAKALELVQQRNAQLEAQLAAKSAESDAISKLANLIGEAVSKNNTVQAVPELDNTNRVSDFKNQRATVDGRNMMESQQVLSSFRSEEKVPISIPKTMANTVGSNLTITVNGVRVSIPCDGKTYYINKTHAEHARERLAKIDNLNANNEPHIVEVS